MDKPSPSPEQTKWDKRWLGLARYVATFSKDPSTQCGAVIVRQDRTVASIGFNGFPRAMPDQDRHYNDRPEKYSRIIHCEMNALLAMKDSPNGCTLYTWPFLTCERCAVHMIQAGIIRAVAPKATPEQMERWGDSLAKAERYFAESGVTVLTYDEDARLGKVSG